MAAKRSALAPGLALIAATTCAAVLVGPPLAFVARFTVTRLPSTNTESGWFAALGFTNSAITLLPPRWPHSRASR